MHQSLAMGSPHIANTTEGRLFYQFFYNCICTCIQSIPVPCPAPALTRTSGPSHVEYRKQRWTARCGGPPSPGPAGVPGSHVNSELGRPTHAKSCETTGFACLLSRSSLPTWSGSCSRVVTPRARQGRPARFSVCCIKPSHVSATSCTLILPSQIGCLHHQRASLY